MANKGVSLKVGAVTYKSISAAWKAAQRNAERRGHKTIGYMTFYMRIRNGMTPSQAIVKEVRQYNKKIAETIESFENEIESVESVEEIAA